MAAYPTVKMQSSHAIRDLSHRLSWFLYYHGRRHQQSWLHATLIILVDGIVSGVVNSGVCQIQFSGLSSVSKTTCLILSSNGLILRVLVGKDHVVKQL